MKQLLTFDQHLNESTAPRLTVEKRGKDLPIANAVKEVNSKLNRLGVKTKVTVSQMENAKPNKNGDLVVTLPKIKINTDSLGAFSPVFKSAEVEPTVVYGDSNQAMVLVLQYSWTHPNGSNGYTFRDSFWDGKWVGY